MKKGLKKVLGVTLAAALASSFMAGCSADGGGRTAAETTAKTEQAAGSSEAARTEGAGEEQIEISFWDGNWQEGVWPEVEAKWNEEYPHIKIDLSRIVIVIQSFMFFNFKI